MADRVHDYLNDKFQTLADLDALDALLSSVQDHQAQLRSQLTSAETSADNAKDAAAAHSRKLSLQAALFTDAQAGIDRRLLATSNADTAFDAASSFASSIEKLQRLDVAEGYLKVLADVQTLTLEAQKHVGGDPKDALVVYSQLKTSAMELADRNKQADSVLVHLVEFVERSREGVWKNLKRGVQEQLEKVLDRVGWPGEQTIIKGHEEEFGEALKKCLVLQWVELGGPVVLLPFETMVKPLALKFRYHFEGDRPTNRIDKPEWFLSHLASMVTTYASFLSESVQPILSINPDLGPRDAITEFTTALLPILRHKLQSLIPEVGTDAQLLSHLIHELIKFDTQLREEYYYRPYGTTTPWKGITHEVLVQQDEFPSWVRVEKDFALARYHAIVSAPDAWTIDYDSVSPSDTKPTKSALRIKDLIETVTETYRPLLSFSQRLRFLIDIQIAILDQYHSRLRDSLEAFKMLASSFARAVQGIPKEQAQDTTKLSGLERLCRVYGSAQFLESCMRDWGENIFFLSLWNELQMRARTGSSEPLAGDMNVQDIANITSAAVGCNDADDGALFDETAAAYKQLEGAAEELIVEHILGAIREDLRLYSRITIWSSTESVPSDTDTISPEIAPVLASLAEYMSFLHRTMAPASTRRVWRSLAEGVDVFFWDYVVGRNQFSALGGRQLKRDLEELIKVAGKWVNGSERSVRRTVEAARILSLDVGGEEGLEMAKAAFHTGNDEAREFCAKIGIHVLGLPEIRGVLERRVEAW